MRESTAARPRPNRVGASRNGNERSRPASVNGHQLNGYRSTNLNRYTTPSRIYQWHTRVFHDEVMDLVKVANPTSILDAGCGEGFVANLIANHTPEADLTGIDQSREAIDFARHHFGDAADFEIASVFELPFPDDSFDLVICSEVLEHLHDPAAAMDELVRVAARHVLITVPREPIFQFLNDVGKSLRLCGDPGHVQFWDKEGFQEFFAPYFSETTFRWKHTYQLLLGRVG